MNVILQLFIISVGFLATRAQVPQKTYTLKLLEDVTLEAGNENFNYLRYLIVGTHPRYPLKRSLLRFQNIPSDCVLPLSAILHVYFVYAHKASFMSEQEVPKFTRRIAAFTVRKYWTESQATSTYRRKDLNQKWTQPWLKIGDDSGSDAYNDALYDTEIDPDTHDKWYTLDVTTQARKWKSGQNYGLLLRDLDELKDGRDFRFASNAYSDSSKHAYITLTCQVQQQQQVIGVIPIGQGGHPI